MSKTGNLNRKKPCQRCGTAPRIPGGGNRYCDGCRTIARATPPKPTPVDRIGSKQPIVHGTIKGYHQCVKLPDGSCEPCRVAYRARAAELRRRRGSQERKGPSTMADLLTARTGPPTDAGCWPWTGQIDPQGYGRLSFTDPLVPKSEPRRLREKRFGAHRCSYEHYVGPIPTGLTLDHVCHSRDTDCAGGPRCPHRRCVNPDHLEPVTSAVNTMRGRSLSTINATKTHCIHGHEFTPENTYRGPDGARSCRTCQREKDRRRYREARAS